MINVRLMASVAKLAFDANGQPNRYAFHDVGLAVGQAEGRLEVVQQRRPLVPRHCRAARAQGLAVDQDLVTHLDELAQQDQLTRTPKHYLQQFHARYNPDADKLAKEGINGEQRTSISNAL